MRIHSMFRLHTSDYRSSRRARRRVVRPRLEALDDRLLLSTFTVTSGGDSGPASLRQAIFQANNGQLGSFPSIVFNLPSATVALTSALPAITANNVTIEGANGGNGVTIEGTGNNVVGLKLAGNGCKLDNLALTNCQVGIFAQGSGENIQNSDITSSNLGFLDEGTNDTINLCDFGGLGAGNGIGLEAYHSTGLSISLTATDGNFDDGIEVVDSTGFLFGGDCEVRYNGNDGMFVTGGSTPGTAQDFTTSIQGASISGNGENGVDIVGSSGNLVGGAVTEQGLAATTIGYDPTAKAINPDGNNGDGVLIEGTAQSPSENNTVAECSIAGNFGDGVRITGPGSTLNILSNNFIGIDFGPTADNAIPPEEVLGNSVDGVGSTAARTRTRSAAWGSSSMGARAAGPATSSWPAAPTGSGSPARGPRSTWSWAT